MPPSDIDFIPRGLFEPFLSVTLDRNIDIADDELDRLHSRIHTIGHADTEKWSPPAPASGASVWRYLDFTQLLSILERDEIWFNSVGGFDDPYEGTIPEPNLSTEVEEIEENFDLTSDEIIKIIQQIFLYGTGGGGGSYVNCWNVNEHQSAALWEQYVDAKEGVAIQTTVSNLEDALEPAEMDFEFGNVEYIDYNKDEISSGHLPRIYHKRQSFEHESEFRISYIPGVEENHGPGFYAKVDKDVLIERLVISPIAPDWFSNLVEKVLDRYDVDCKVRESDLYSNPEISIK